jgi:hypothetical protein
VAAGALLAIAGVLVVTACSHAGSSESTSGGVAPSAPANGRSASDKLNPPVPFSAGVAGASASHQSASSGLLKISPSELGRSQIKTASIGLRSTQVQTVVTKVQGVAAGQGGFVDSEDTQTNTHGVATSSVITIKVPVDSFDASVASVSTLGQLASKKVTTEDVTGRVADVASRVTSARDAIAQLRLLFSHATKLSDIITLESELTSREADLEALQAEQRALTEQTTLSTITVGVTRPAAQQPPPPHQASTSGFVGGLRQGWDALVTTASTLGHAIGAAIPLGLAILVIGSLGWLLVRRLPRHRVDTSG